MADVYAYVAHKDGRLGGVCSALAGKKGVKDFINEFATDGFTVQPVATRAEYDSLTEKMPAWHQDAALQEAGRS